MARSQGGNSILPPTRGRSTAFASLRSKCCRVGVLPLARVFADDRGRGSTPHAPPHQVGGRPPPFRGRYCGACWSLLHRWVHTRLPCLSTRAPRLVRPWRPSDVP